MSQKNFDNENQNHFKHSHSHDEHVEHNHSEHNHSEHTHKHDKHAEHKNCDHDHSGHDHHEHGDFADVHSHGYFDFLGLPDYINHILELAFEFCILFLVISMIITFILEYLPPRYIEKLFAIRKSEQNSKVNITLFQNLRPYLYAVIFAMLTPVCTFSTVPMIQGLLRAKASFGPTMAFLFSSPLLSPIIISLLFTVFGVKISLIYILGIIVFSIAMGILYQKFGMERYVIYSGVHVCASNNCCDANHLPLQSATTFGGKLCLAFIQSLKNLKRAGPYLIVGLILGSLLHGYTPDTFLTGQSQNNSIWLAIPLASILGLPLHVHVETLIPISSALLHKGMGLGTLMALILSSGGTSLAGLSVLKAFFRFLLLIAIVISTFCLALVLGIVYQII